MNPLNTENWSLSDWALLSYQLRLHKPIAARGANAHIRHGFLVIKKNPWGIGIGDEAAVHAVAAPVAARPAAALRRQVRPRA